MRSKASHKRSYAGFLGAQGGPPAAPGNTGLPVVTGSATVGQVLTATAGDWSGREAPDTFLFQWKANGVDIAGATGPELLLSPAEIGSVITFAVTAKNWKGSASATSAPTSAVVAAG